LEKDLNGKSMTIIALFVFSMFCLKAARSWGYFSLPEEREPQREVLQGVDCLFVFMLYFSMMALFPSLLFAQLAGPDSDYSSYLAQWISTGAVWATSALFLTLMAFLSREKRAAIWGEGRFLPSICFGYATFFIAYPVVCAVNASITTLIALISSAPLEEQVAITFVKEASAEYLLFIASCLNICLLAPFLEEVLFRGFLQTYLKKHLGISGSIVSSSLIFALLHFSARQGKENFILIPCLFLLSLFLGWNRERSKSLFTSIGLHAAFNQVNIMALLLHL
jgi:membrane protease YdiL (CAAX protease family)